MSTEKMHGRIVMKTVIAIGCVLVISIAVFAATVLATTVVFSAEEDEQKPFTTMTNSIGMKLVLLPAGDFLMGGPGRGKGSDKPVHRVRITKPFWMGVYEVTQREYEAMGCVNKSSYLDPDMPVQDVLWQRAAEFCRKLSEKESVTYRLPTEAEWEYACRANKGAMYSIGELPEHAWYKDNSGLKPHPVGQLKPNAWGLYDICGNVWEWCSDLFSRTYYEKSPTDDPKGGNKGSDRVLRGGCWYSYPSATSAFYRYRLNEKYDRLKGGDVGFRVVMECKAG